MVRFGATTVLVVLAGCSAGEGTAPLHVALKTDYTPIVEFQLVRIEVDLVDPMGNMVPWRSTRHTASEGEDYLEGVALTTVSVPTDRPAQLTGTLLVAGEDVVARRRLRLEVHEPTAVTVLISRSCDDVFCPPDDEGNERTCVGGRCVDARCSADTPTACESGLCETDGDCAGGVECVEGRCEDGFCLVVTHEDRCDPGSRCSPTAGCVPLPPGQCRDVTDCGTIANGSATCVGGVCILECDAGFDDCDTSAGTGCEVDLSTNPLHCGACFDACPTGDGVVNALCEAGGCDLACEDGREDCNGDVEDGCEATLGTEEHCSSCEPCGGGQLCCDGECVSGSTETHCGECGRGCPDGERCVGDTCEVVGG